MEAFKVFATFSLLDLMSSPLARIRAGMADADKSAASLSARFGSLAMGMAPLAAAGGAMLGAFGKCIATASGFEDQMAKVGAISRASASEMQALTAKARELGASTQFTASQVAQAEQYLAMAGFSVEQNMAALPGVLNLAAATSTDLGRAADIASDIMGAFGLKAEEMTRVADTLALTCAQANVDMALLGDTMKYCAPVAKKAGLSLEETAAMAGLLGDVGIKGSQAGTTLKAMLNKMAAPTSEATKLLQKLGVTTKDAAGNLRSPVKVLGELTGKLKGMGSADQIAAMKKIVGEEAMAGFSELLNQADGGGKLLEKINNLLKGGGTAAQMAARQNDSLAGDVRSLGSAFESAQITIGNIFIPILRQGTAGLTNLVRWFDKLAQNPAGKQLVKFAAVLSVALAAVTAFAAGLWAVSSAGGALARVFMPLKASILGLGAPMLIVIGVIALLYAAFKNNFGGIATFFTDIWNKISIAVRGVTAVFQNLKNGASEIKGELATQIKANGLTGFVQTVSRVIARALDLFSGFKKGLGSGIDTLKNVFDSVRIAVAQVILSIGNLFGAFSGDEVTSSREAWADFGEILGKIASIILTGLATAISVAVTSLDSVISAVRLIAALFTGDFSTACAMATRIWDNLCQSLLAIADYLGIGDWLRNTASQISKFFANLNFTDGIKSAWNALTGFLASLNPLDLIANAFAGVAEFLASLNLFGGLQMAWQTVCNFISSLNPLDLLATAFAGLTVFFASLDFVSGFASAWAAVTAFFDGLNLFESGAKLLSTFIEGIRSMAGSLVDSVSGALAKVRSFLPFSDAHEGPLSTLTLSGSRMMTTLAEGVNQGKGALAASVSSALGEAGKAISGFDSTLAQPEMEKAALPRQELPLPATDIAKRELPSLPAFSAVLEAPSLPALELAEIPDFDALELPEIPALEVAELPVVSASLAAPEIPDLRLAEVPQPEAPALIIPEAPAVAPEDTVNDRGHNEGQPKTQTVTITIGTINLPDVTDGQGLLKSLNSLMQSEIGALEGMA